MPQPTSILDTLLDFKRTIVGQRTWHNKRRKRRICITCGRMRLEYYAKHVHGWKEV